MSSDSTIKLGILAEKLGIKLVGDTNKSINGLGTLKGASSSELTFLSRPAYLKFLNETQAGAVILKEEFAEFCPCDYLISEDPYLSYAKASHIFKELLHPKNESLISSDPPCFIQKFLISSFII